MAADERYPLALPQGTILAGQYIIDCVLGQGGFGITYRAVDHKTGQKVAVKEFFPDSMATRTQTTVTAFSGERGESFAYGKSCFLQEAETLAEFIGNENIVKVHSYFEENGTAYFVMDFVEGISFDRYIKEHGGRISYEEAEKILLPVMDALAAVHSRGIVHRDVTPDNIYITKDGTVKLLDFGAARYSLGDRSRSLDVVLKHGFAPKEQYTRRGKQGSFTDVYTVGASFYFAVTGRRPPDSIDRLDEDDLVPPSSLGVSIPSKKEDALLKAMSVQPSERFQNMTEFKQALLSENAAVGAAGAAGETPVRFQPEQVQQRFFTKPGQPIPINRQIPPGQTVHQEGSGKKKWLLPVSIAGGVAALTAVIVISVAAGANPNYNEEETAHYEVVEEPANSGKYDVAEKPESDGDYEDDIEGNNPLALESELPEEPAAPEVELLGNTPNNIMNYGQCSYDGETKIVLACPGGHGMIAGDADGNALYLDEDGYVRCISIVGDKVYYINTGTAYSVNLDGTDKELIWELSGYEKIATLYVSDDYYYIYNNESRGVLRCIERGTGNLMGSLICDKSDWLTFLDGYVYFIQGDDESTLQFCRVPADDIGAEPENLLGAESEDLLSSGELQTCSVLAAETPYVYGVTGNEEDGSLNMKIFQYNTDTENLDCTYSFTDWLQTGFPGLLNVCGQYVYFVFQNYSEEDEYINSTLYRFNAGPEEESMNVETVYEGEFGEYFDYLTVLEDASAAVISTWGSCDAIVLVNADGTGEPAVLTDEMYDGY